MEINSQYIFCEQAYQQSESVEKRRTEKTSTIKKFVLRIFKREHQTYPSYNDQTHIQEYVGVLLFRKEYSS